DALGYQWPTAQSYSLQVATKGPCTRSAYGCRAPSLPNGLPFAGENVKWEKAAWTSTSEATGLASADGIPLSAKDTRRPPKLCPTRCTRTSDRPSVACSGTRSGAGPSQPPPPPRAF